MYKYKMETDHKGDIVSNFDVDDNLALQMWTKGRSPRLVIFNKGKNTRKLIPLSWVERRDRKLSIKGAKGATVSYAIQDFEPALESLLAEYDVRTNFRIRLWKFAAELEKIIHAPDSVMDKSEFKMLSEDKRSSLWIIDFSDSKKGGVYLPFFPMSEAEAAGLPRDRMLVSVVGRGAEGLIKSGAPRALAKANPVRWQNPIRVAAAAMLMGFSYCDADGAEFMDSLWDKDIPPFTLRDPRIGGLGQKLVAYIRHFDAVEQVEGSVSMGSSTKELQDQGYERKRRLDFQPGAIGDVPYRVTFFEHEGEGRIGLGCEPQSATARHKGELVYTIPLDVYGTALKNDTLGGPEDEFYTVTQLVWARQFKDWYNNVTPYIRGFAGLM